MWLQVAGFWQAMYAKGVRVHGFCAIGGEWDTMGLLSVLPAQLQLFRLGEGEFTVGLQGARSAHHMHAVNAGDGVPYVKRDIEATPTVNVA